MEDDQSPTDVRTTDADHKRRWVIATTVVAVFLVALFIGMWVGGDVFGN